MNNYFLTPEKIVIREIFPKIFSKTELRLFYRHRTCSIQVRKTTKEIVLKKNKITEPPSTKFPQPPKVEDPKAIPSTTKKNVPDHSTGAYKDVGASRPTVIRSKNDEKTVEDAPELGEEQAP